MVYLSRSGARSQPCPDMDLENLSHARSSMEFLRSGKPIWLRLERRLLLGRERLRMLGLTMREAEVIEDGDILMYASQHCMDLYSMSLGFAAALSSLKLEYFRHSGRCASGSSS